MHAAAAAAVACMPVRSTFMPVHACRFMHAACNMHAACMPVHACRSMHAGSCQLLMCACARRAYCKKCRVNLGSKSSGWSNIPDLILYLSTVIYCTYGRRHRKIPLNLYFRHFNIPTRTKNSCRF
jgi:hypothetical protein